MAIWLKWSTWRRVCDKVGAYVWTSVYSRQATRQRVLLMNIPWAWARQQQLLPPFFFSFFFFFFFLVLTQIRRSFPLFMPREESFYPFFFLILSTVVFTWRGITGKTMCFYLKVGRGYKWNNHNLFRLWTKISFMSNLVKKNGAFFYCDCVDIFLSSK